MEGWTGKYVDPRKAANSWRPKSGSMSPGLRRAREPFLVRNIITGVLLGTFAVGIYAYSIQAVKQDNFEDLDEDVKAKLQKDKLEQEKKRVMQGVLSADEEKDVMDRAAGFVVDRVQAGTGLGASTPGNIDIAQSMVDEIITEHSGSSPFSSQARYRGLLVNSSLDKRFPWLLEPHSKTLVWGAPPLDRS